jgi:RNA-directed DNA polymerase
MGYVRGWMAHYGCGLKYNDAVELDGWIRRRLRMSYWKQWRKPRQNSPSGYGPIDT